MLTCFARLSRHPEYLLMIALVGNIALAQQSNVARILKRDRPANYQSSRPPRSN
jgi:hypothetical protein